MGVSYMSYLLSWLLYFLLNGVLISAVMLAITKFLIITEETAFSPGYSFWDLAPLYLVFMLSNIGYILFLCCFFSKAKTGSQAITFLQLISNFLYFLRFASDVATSKIAVIFLGIFPQMSFNMAVTDIAFQRSEYSAFWFNFSYSQGMITLIASFFAFTLIALYLDEVIPNELGTHKHPLFFLGCGRKTERDQLHRPLLQDSEEGLQESSAKYE